MSWLPKNCVVVPFDFSAESANAIITAQAFVEDIRNLHVVHILPQMLLSEPGIYWGAMDDDKRRQHAVIAFRNRPAEGTLRDIDFTVRIGDAGREIVSFAEQIKADLIVMPSHGRTGFNRLVLGSVAERVVRLARCSVLILKSPLAEARMNWLPKRCVVAPFDFSKASERAVGLTTAFVDNPRNVHLVHVLPELGLDEANIYPDPANDELRCQRMTHAYCERAAEISSSCLDFQTRIGDPGREIAKFAEAKKADLIVMSSHGRSGFDQWLLGSVAERVVRLAHCPVLIIKPPVDKTAASECSEGG